MKCKILTLNDPGYPDVLRNTVGAPKQLYYLGAEPKLLLDNTIAIGIVGSRKITPYGRYVTQKLARDLTRVGVVIISGLAFGVDALAHQTALAEGRSVIAVLPCGLDAVYPSSHQRLAEEILKKGGTLLSEYEEGTPPLKQHFIARNRIISGLSQGLLITEAAEKSGSLHTANFALEQGRDVFAVPGNINSPFSAGTNNLLKAGAHPVTDASDVLRVYGYDDVRKDSRAGANEEEARILALLNEGITDSHELMKASGLPAEAFSQTLTMLEISAKIRPVGAGQWTIS